MMSSASRWRTGLAWLTAVAAVAALIVAFVLTPPESAMGQRIRILYVHVGSAWTAYLSYVVTAFGAALYLRQRRRRWDHLAVGSAELGLVLTTLTLATGSLWGRSTQGWWWVWEPRLTITLLMWFLYAAYLILRQYTEGERRAVVSAVLALAGVPTMILNHFAVVMFRSFHPQPVIVRPDGPALESPWYVVGMVLSLATFSLVYALFLLARMDLEVDRDELLALRHAEPESGALETGARARVR
jgi:heme exporter protein C